ncbi:MAG: hypothetical protein KIT72_03495 [Polyangiaceae bacterium]|nr:hypothetical protein [Polyangiaceae bacterium]
MTRFEAGALVAAAVTLGGAYWLFSTDASARDARGEAEHTASEILTAARAYQEDRGVGCPSLTELERRYGLKGSGEDPWGGRFRLICDEEGLSVLSAGEDGRFGTADDVERRG